MTQFTVTTDLILDMPSKEEIARWLIRELNARYGNGKFVFEVSLGAGED